jgi:phosphoribosylaminoimidazole-succinocarboxamide synthase
MDSFDVTYRYPKSYELEHRVFHGVCSHLNSVGIELIDTKLEMGRLIEDASAILADEVFTPDSSRFCNSADIQEGRDPSWLDKQIARDYAEKIWRSDKKTPVLFPDDVLLQLTNTYRDLFERITERTLEQFQSY